MRSQVSVITPVNGGLLSTVLEDPLPSPTSLATPDLPRPLSIVTTAHERPKRRIPIPLDLSSARGNRSAAPMLALSNARIVDDLSAVPYPESVKAPNLDLNIAVMPGKFRYDREFLLQFMGVCREKPESLVPLGILGLEPGEGGGGYSASTRAGNRRVGSMGMGIPSLSRQASMGLGLGPGLTKDGGFAMDNFQSPTRGMDSQSRFDASNNARGAMPFAGPAGARLAPMTRSASQGGVGGGGPREAKRTRSQRGKKAGESGMSECGVQTPSQQPRTLQKVEKHHLVGRQVKALLNKLTVDKFDSISDQIIAYANRSEQERDGSTLMQVVGLTFEHAKNDPKLSEMYARLCRKMMERVSPKVQDETIRGSDGQPIAGGMLFRKYLLNRCQENFERGWSAKEAPLAAAQSKADSDKAAKSASEANDAAVLYFAAKARRQGLGFIQFVGELFRLSMLTERIMHEYIKKLLSNHTDPEEVEIESLCKLLTAVGQRLDNPKARNHIDIYFERMGEMAKGNNINSRMQFMILASDVIELRSRQWQARSAMLRPLPQKQDKGDHSVQRGGTNTRPPARAGDLSQFGKISKSSALQFGPTSVFNKKGPNRQPSMRASGANMFAALGGGVPMPTPMERTPSSRKPNVDLGPGGAPARGRKMLNLTLRANPLRSTEDKQAAAPEALPGGLR